MPSRPDSSDIDEALSRTLRDDATLAALMPDGVYFDVAGPNAERFVLISLADEVDMPIFGGNGYESALYLVKAVALESTGGNVKAAAARIQDLLEDQPINLLAGSPAGVPGYTWMTCHRESRVRQTEVDEQDPNIRWNHRGGRYRVDMSVG